MSTTTIYIGDSNAPTIYFLSGLPASGKSSWAKAQQTLTPSMVIISKDNYRPLFGGYSEENEVLVRATTRAAGMQALQSGRDIIVDDTNLVLKYRNYWETYARQHNISMLHIHFDTPVDVCVDRDAIRPDQYKVGEARIREMYKKYVSLEKLDGVIKYREQDPTLQKAIIVDIDGTLAMANGRNPYDDTMLYTDLPNKPVVDLVHLLAKDGNTVIVMSGRQSTDSCLTQTKEWLDEHLKCPYMLFMRDEGDTRKDSIVKKELFVQYVEPYCNITLVLDDRDQVVDLWRNTLNLPCLQVNYGNF